MRWLGDAVAERGIEERTFHLERAGRLVPGVVWAAEGADPGSPRVLVGHGASGHKHFDYVVAVSRWLVRRHGFVAVAIDGPVHGDRREGGPTADGMAEFTEFNQAVVTDPGLIDGMVGDWRAVLDALEAQGWDGPVGYWGLSMGALFGVPVVAADPRIEVAALGLMGPLRGISDRLRADAARITCPVIFLLQWDDELIPRDLALDLFDHIGTTDKRLHAHPGRHIEVPREAFEATEQFLGHHLSPG